MDAVCMQTVNKIYIGIMRPMSCFVARSPIAINDVRVDLIRDDNTFCMCGWFCHGMKLYVSQSVAHMTCRPLCCCILHILSPQGSDLRSHNKDSQRRFEMALNLEDKGGTSLAYLILELWNYT